MTAHCVFTGTCGVFARELADAREDAGPMRHQREELLVTNVTFCDAFNLATNRSRGGLAVLHARHTCGELDLRGENPPPSIDRSANGGLRGALGSALGLGLSMG